MHSPIYFDATLSPHRSLGPRGLILLTLIFAGCLTSIAVYFFLIGAWPIAGFAGVDFLLVGYLLHLHHRSGKINERIVLANDFLTVFRRDPSGRQSEMQIQPGWLRIERVRDRRGRLGVGLGTQGIWHIVGQFLAYSEQSSLASALREALGCWKRGHSLVEPRDATRGIPGNSSRRPSSYS